MNRTRRDFVIGALGFPGALLMPGIAGARDADAGAVEIGGAAFGTTWRALVPTRIETSQLAQDAGWLLQSLDAVMSPFRTDSELTWLNAINGRVNISKELADVIYEGLRIARLTNGAFDPTIGPTVAKFGFGPIRGSTATKASAVDYHGLELIGRTVTKSGREFTFDPCGIGKGYALDRLGDLLVARGIKAFFIEFGGEVLVRGLHPSVRPWRIAIESPTAGVTNPRHVIAMKSGALATSGDRQNSYIVGGRRYSHIIDPRTAAPVYNDVASVSVMARSAMTADALATAFMVMGPERSLALADREGLPALFVLRAEDGYRDIATAAFRANIAT